MKKIITLILAAVMLMSIIPMGASAATTPVEWPQSAGEKVIATFDEEDAAIGRNYYREDGAASDTYLPQNKAYAYADDGTTVNATIADGKLSLEYTEVAEGKYATIAVYTDPQQNQNITANTGMLVFHLDTTGITSMEAGAQIGVRFTMSKSNGWGGSSAVAYVLNSKTVYFQADGSDVLEERTTRAADSVWDCYLDVKAGESGTYYVPIDAFLSDEDAPLTNWTYTQTDLDQLIVDQAESWRHNSSINLNFRCTDISANDVITVDNFKWAYEYPLSYKHKTVTQDFSEFVPNFNWTWIYGNLSGYSNNPDNAVTKDEISVIDGRFAVTPNNTAASGMRFTITLDEIGAKWDADKEAFAFDLDLSETTGNMTGRFKFVGRTRIPNPEDPEAQGTLEVSTFAVYNGTMYFVEEDGDVTPVVMADGNGNTQWAIPVGFKGTVIIPADLVKKESGAETTTINDDYTEFGFQYELLNWNAADNGASVYVDNLGYYDNACVWETEYTTDEKGHWIECSICGDKQADPVAHTGGEATCTTQATCEVCGASYGVYAAHTLTPVEPSEADHNNAGNIAYWSCDVCDKCFSDESGISEIDKADTVIEKVPHAFGDWQKDDNQHWKECECGAEDGRADHVFDGATDTTCDICNHTRELALNGWVKDGDTWYFYVDNTAVTSKWMKDSTGWVYLGSNGAMVTNQWVQDSYGWCFVGANGYCVTNTFKADSKGWCYLGSEGSQVKNNWVLDGGKWYFIGADGYMVSSKWMKDSKGWVYLGSNGAMVYNAWVKDSNGWCFVGADGYCVTSKWVRDSKGWCWLNADGNLVTNNWVAYNGKWYFMDPDGHMVTGAYTIKGKVNNFDANGVWLG